MAFHCNEWKHLYWILWNCFPVLSNLSTCWTCKCACCALRSHEFHSKSDGNGAAAAKISSRVNVHACRCVQVGRIVSVTHVFVRVWGLETLNKSFETEPFSNWSPFRSGHVTSAPSGGPFILRLGQASPPNHCSQWGAFYTRLGQASPPNHCVRRACA